MIACAKALMAAGATTIDAIVTHALFPPELVAQTFRGRHPLDPLDRQRAASDQRDHARWHPWPAPCARGEWEQP